jgi:hypothetical protein
MTNGTPFVLKGLSRQGCWKNFGFLRLASAHHDSIFGMPMKTENLSDVLSSANQSWGKNIEISTSKLDSWEPFSLKGTLMSYRSGSFKSLQYLPYKALLQ